LPLPTRNDARAGTIRAGPSLVSKAQDAEALAAELATQGGIELRATDMEIGLRVRVSRYRLAG
jgi:hypothetical protein